VLVASIALLVLVQRRFVVVLLVEGMNANVKHQRLQRRSKRKQIRISF